MRMVSIPKPLKFAAYAALAALVVSCSTSRSPQYKAPPITYGGDINHAHPDGAPWWDVDVSKIPDAVPMVYNGAYKANPYTVLGKTYYPMPDAKHYLATGTASWYGTKFHGQATANGEKYDLYGMSAAHKTLPLPSYVRVTNLDNGRSVILRVNDRGPFYSDRIIDLSYAAAKKLGYAETGTARVKVEGIDPQEWWAQRGGTMPLMLAQPQMAQAPARPPVQGTITQAPMIAGVEQYTPPPAQHAAPTNPAQIDAKKNGSVPVAGLYLQVGAFANPDAAELLKDKISGVVTAQVFISPIVRNQQTLYRLRLGPYPSPAEAQVAQASLRQNNLGAASLVHAE